MSVKELIEDIIAKELNSLCITCSASQECAFRKKYHKPVIQCELYELGGENSCQPAPDQKSVKGLCSDCVNYATCHFSAKLVGVWHCEEYQ